MTPPRFRLSDLLHCAALVALYCGVLAMILRGATRTEALRSCGSVLIGVAVFFAGEAWLHRGAKRAAAPIRLELPVQFQWIWHIGQVVIAILLTLAFHQFSAPGELMGLTIAPFAFVIGSIVHRNALLGEGGIVVGDRLFSWKLSRPDYDSEQALVSLRVGRSWLAHRIPVPREYRKAIQSILTEYGPLGVA